MLCRPRKTKLNADKLGAIDHVLTRVGRGVYKRIDENRELLELLQERAPEFLDKAPWVTGWLKAHDDFFVELAKAAQMENHQADYRSGGYPRTRQTDAKPQSRPGM